MDTPNVLGFNPPLPQAVGRFGGRVLVCGSARCLWDDLARVPHGQGYDVMAINFAGLFLPRRLNHWVSLHGVLFDSLRGGRAYMQRHLDKRAPPYITHALNPRTTVDHVWRDTIGQDSGLYGVRIALMLGYEEVLLAGMPVDGTGHFYEDPRVAHIGFESRPQWERFAKVFAGRVRSLSGWTRELFAAQ